MYAGTLGVAASVLFLMSMDQFKVRTWLYDVFESGHTTGDLPGGEAKRIHEWPSLCLKKEAGDLSLP